MSALVIPFERRASAGALAQAAARTDASPAAQYGLALLFVALATVLAFVVENLIAAPNLTLIFVLPVVLAAIAFGWRPAMMAAVAGVLAFDFFFTRPYYSLRIATPSDLWAAGLLLVIAAIVSSLAAEARRRAVEAERAAAQSAALQGLAQAVIEGRPEPAVFRSAAAALHHVFQAPAVICLRHGEAVSPVASAGFAKLTDADREAAAAAAASGLPIRAESYPCDRSGFDFWPVTTSTGVGGAIGVGFARAHVERPRYPERFVEAVCGYIAAAMAAKALREMRNG